MDTHEKDFTQQHIDEFNQRLERLAAAQEEALLWLGAARAQWDMETLDQPPPPPPLVRARRWLGRSAATLRRRITRRRTTGPQPAMGWPAEEEVVIVDAEYRVIDPDSPAAVFDQQEKRFRWDT
jgi:hypothetical protein